MTGEWQAAVHLRDIREKLLREEDPNQYTIPKKHGNEHQKEPTNYTSFLQKDKDFGPERDNRSHVLFQIKNAKPPTEKPTAYVMDDNRIVLDAYDHGLRDFPNVLPKVLSSELEGHDIEYYYRQNADIADYDLIARMPHAFHHGNEGQHYRDEPPRGGTINQRAQRFRTRAACIAWNNRAGTATKNAFILSLIPDEYKAADVNSTRDFRDLDDGEIKAVNTQNKVKLTKVARNAKDAGKNKKATKGIAKVKKASKGTSKAKKAQTGDLVDDDDFLADVESDEDAEPPLKRAPSQKKTSNPRSARAARTSKSTSNVASDAALVLYSNDSCPVSGSSSGQIQDISEDEQPARQEISLKHPTANTKRKREVDTHQQSRPSKRARVEQQPLPTSASRETSSSYTTWTESNAQSRRHEGTANTTIAHTPSSANPPPSGRSSSAVNFNPDTDMQFKSEVAAGIARGDFRYVAPCGNLTDFEDKWNLNRALELTRNDCFHYTGQMPPTVIWDNHQRECYASHYRRIQEFFERIWEAPESAPALYCLPEWHAGFENWTAPDRRGKELEAVMVDTWGVNADDDSGEEDLVS